VVVWSLGRPTSAYAVRYPDGSRGKVEHVLDHGYRRHATGPKRWIYGTIDVRPDDVLFTDGATQPAYTPPALSDKPDLEAELARDEAFLTALKDDRFARAVYVVFRNRDFLKGHDHRRWLCGDRQAARLVAHLRDLGESYQDYFPHGELKGIWPDDREEREDWIRKQLELVSKPLEFKFEVRVGTRVGRENGSVLVETEHQAQTLREELRREFDQKRPELEEKRRQMRASSERQLAELNQNPNGDVFAALHAHLTRLGWRTENERDREDARLRSRQRKLAILRELKQMEARPAAPPGEWTDQIRKRRASQQGALHVFRADLLRGLSPDEREAETGGVERRLDQLALGGHIMKDEYDDFAARLSRDD
jgi:hypothetical protein